MSNVKIWHFCICVITTLFSLCGLWFISPLNKRFSELEKMIISIGSLGSPFVFPLLCILLWVLFFWS